MEQDHVNSEAPDWAELDIELRCPRCGYNLKMLTLPRCPECGLHFRWDELIRAKTEFHTRPPIFEYHWRDAPIRSFVLTISMCLQPWRLWRWLPLTAVPSISSMACLIVLVLGAFALVSASSEYAWVLYSQVNFGTNRGWTDPNLFLWSWWFPDFWPQIIPPSLLMLAIWCSIQIFWQTIARYQVRQRHILRIVLYCWIGIVGWRIMGDFVLTMLTMPYLSFYGEVLPKLLFEVVDVIPLTMLFLSLGFGFRSYLRVPGGWLWALLLFAFLSMLITIVGFVVSTVVLESFDNEYWDFLIDWCSPFSLLRDLTSWSLRSWHGY